MADVPLKEYLDQRIQELRRHFIMLMEEREKAALRQITVLDAQLSKMNEIREQLNDQAAAFQGRLSIFLTKSEYEAHHSGVVSEIKRVDSAMVTKETLVELQTDIRTLIEWKANLSGKIWAMGIILALLQIGVTVALHLWRS